MQIFNAIGNGIADDTLAIQNMMDFTWKIRDAGVYVNVYFPRGKYKLQSMVQVPNRISMKGDGINASIILPI